MSDKLKNFVFRWRYEAIIFLMTMIPVFININKLTRVHHMYVPYYLFDFSMGINSRMWVGSVVNLLNKHPTEEWIRSFAVIILISGMVLTAVALGSVVKKSKAENRMSVFVLILFFAVGTYTISVFSRFFAMLDIHMYILALLSVVFLTNKHLQWFVPLLCVIGVFVNYVFVMSYFPFVLLALLYFADKNEKKSSVISLFVITAVSVIIATAYCVFEATDHMFMTFEEAVAVMENKIGYALSKEQNEYALGYLFGSNDFVEEAYDLKISELSPVQYIYYFVKYILENRVNAYGAVIIMISAIPVLTAFCTIWIMCIRRSEKKCRKFVYICVILSVLCIPVCCILSTDFVRWIASGIMCQFAMCFLMFYCEDEAFEKTVEKLRAFFSENKLVLVIIFFIYVSVSYLGLTT